MTGLQMKNPASAATLNGVEIENPTKEIRMKHDTATLPKPPAFYAGQDAYPFCRETGRRAAQLWLSGKPRMTLAKFRDNRFAAFSCGTYRTYEERQAFDQGFASALAEHISGVAA